MPSRELLAAATELAEAETLLRDADMEADDGSLIGPLPPAVVAEVESINEAERFEEKKECETSDISRDELWCKAHIRKNGEPLNSVVADCISHRESNNFGMCTIGEAVGSTVAWHKDFLAFD